MKPGDVSWLENTYEQRRLRTVDLTTRAIAQIRLEKGRVSLSKIAAISKRLDVKGKGVSTSAVLSNPTAYELYAASRDWKQLKRFPALVKRHPLDVKIKSERDEKWLRARLRKLTKDELVDRLVSLEASFLQLQKILVSKKVEEVIKIIESPRGR